MIWWKFHENRMLRSAKTKLPPLTLTSWVKDANPLITFLSSFSSTLICQDQCHWHRYHIFSFPHRKSQKWLKKSQYVVNISNTCNLINKDPNQQIFNMVFNAAGPPHSPPRALWTGSRPLQGRNPLSIPQHQVLHIVPTAKTSAHQTCM